MFTCTGSRPLSRLLREGEQNLNVLYFRKLLLELHTNPTRELAPLLHAVQLQASADQAVDLRRHDFPRWAGSVVAQI